MWTRSEFAKFIIEHERRLIKAPYEHGFSSDAPEPRPSRPEPEPRQLRQSEQPGISMNELARSIPRPRPPRAPGRQSISPRFNGLWWHY
jgi:hypothetical protein